MKHFNTTAIGLCLIAIPSAAFYTAAGWPGVAIGWLIIFTAAACLLPFLMASPALHASEAPDELAVPTTDDLIDAGFEPEAKPTPDAGLPPHSSKVIITPNATYPLMGTRYYVNALGQKIEVYG